MRSIAPVAGSTITTAVTTFAAPADRRTPQRDEVARIAGGVDLQRLLEQQLVP
jgi:hypothetical protein